MLAPSHNDVNESWSRVGRIDCLTRPRGERGPIIQGRTRWNVKSGPVWIGAEVYIEHQVYDEATTGDTPMSFNHRRSLHTALDLVVTVPGRTDGLSAIGLINGRDQEGLRPRDRAAQHERDPVCLTRPASMASRTSGGRTQIRERRSRLQRHVRRATRPTSRRHGGWANGRRELLPQGVGLASLYIISRKIIRQTDH